MIKTDKKIKNVFFDLDGTLLPMDMDEFVYSYVSGLCKAFPDLKPQAIKQVLFQGIEAMYKNDGTKTNEEVFINAFNSTGISFEKNKERFEKFYEENFDLLKNICKPTEISKRIIDTLKNKGYTICIATNPLFPQIATYKRLSWIGIDPNEVSLVTTYENSSFTKPNPKYYIEICDKLSVNPSETIMFGNDVLEDGASIKAGIDAVIVVDCLVNSHNLPLEEFQVCKLEDVLEFCLSLEKIN